MKPLEATIPYQQQAGKSNRLRSLDALRGFDMFWIVCGEGIFHGIAAVIKQKYSLTQSTVNWRIATDDRLSAIEKFFVGISNQLHHSPWEGLSFYDIIFPLFIFIAGVSMHYSFSNQLEKAGADQPGVRKKIWWSLIKRTIILILLGMVVNGDLQFKAYENTRFASVLGRIALSCFFAAVIYLNCSLRAQIAWCIGLLLSYWAAMTLIPVPVFGAGVLTPEGNLAAWFDRLFLPGKLHRTVYDPEGLLSTIPAICTALLGMFTGRFLKSASSKKTLTMIAAGLILILIGWLWSFAFPIIKTIWTSSYVLVTAGLSLLLFALFYFIIDVKGYQKWCMPFVWMGMNSILIYVMAHGLINFEYTSQFVFGGLIHFVPEIWHSALLWVGVALIQFTILYFLYRRKWFLKL